MTQSDANCSLHQVYSNPRARIAARYVSLLRYLCAWREPLTNMRYKAIVIVAHSQGTAITGDLLRFIRVECSASGNQTFQSYDGALSRLDGDLPVYLFTMGSPLHQVYARLFPDLYKWTRADGSPVQQDASISCAARPNCENVGVKRWTNAFCSGDYIGRQLWASENSPSLWHIPTLPQEDKAADNSLLELSGNVFQDCGKTRREFCIGKGAHTHYWDATASLIAFELDRIIGSQA